MPLISIIIPVYKVEAYLHKCVNSVLDQDFKDIEVLLVDDGSPDNCPAICDEFTKKDARVKVIHKKNGGLSDARNEGMKSATGEYIMFLDSDDYWDGKDCLFNLIQSMQVSNADIILYGAKDVFVESNTVRVARGNYDIAAIRKGKDAAIQSLFVTHHFPGSAWILTIKRCLVLEHELFFITGIKAEDIDWLMHVFSKAESFDAVNDPFYMYFKNRQGAITTTADFKSAKDVLFSVAKWTIILEKDSSVTNAFLLSYLAYQYITAYIIYSGVPLNEKSKLYAELHKNIGILKYAQGKRTLLSRKIIELFGIELGSKFFKIVHFAMNKWPSLKKII
jgi:glycosyltransferase involved in cell wall biosynthesis